MHPNDGEFLNEKSRLVPYFLPWNRLSNFRQTSEQLPNQMDKLSEL